MTRPDRIGPRIRRARERLHLDRKTLAAKVGVSARAVYDWEHDRTYPRNRIGALEEVLGVDLTTASGTPAAEYADPVLQDLWERLQGVDLSPQARRTLVEYAHFLRTRETRTREDA